MGKNLPAAMTALPQLGDQEAIEFGRLEAVVDEALGAARTASTRAKLALQRIRDQRLYRADFSSFEDYVVTRWRVSKTTAYRWIDQGRPLLELEAGDPLADNAQNGHGEDVSAGQRVPPWDVPKSDGPVDVPSMELDEGGQGVLDTPDVLSGKSGETPRTTPTKREGDGGQKPDGSSGSPRAHPGAAPAAEKAGEAKLEVPKPTRSSTPQAGGESAPSAPPPPSGFPMPRNDGEVRDLVAFVGKTGRWKITEAMNKVPRTVALQTVEDAIRELQAVRIGLVGADKKAALPPRPREVVNRLKGNGKR